MKTITLTPGYSFHNFNAILGENTLRFKLNWLTRYRYYSVDISDVNYKPIALGRALHPGIDLLAGLNTSIGKLILEGAQPTVSNLGIDNKLRWYAE